MFIHTKASTKCLTVDKSPLSPKLILHYVKTFMDRADEESEAKIGRIKRSVYPKFAMRYGTKTDLNDILLFYRIKDLYQQILTDWGHFDMVIQPYIICKSRKASMLRYEAYGENMLRAVSISNDHSVTTFPYLKQEDIINYRKDETNCQILKINKNESKTEYTEIGKIDLISV
jgi:hypothetical protein